MLVVDTSVWIDFLNGHASREAEYLARCLSDDVPIVLPGIVLTELLAGLKTEADARRIASLLDAFEASPEASRDDYRAAAGMFRACRQAGRSVGSVVDCVIAQTCVRNGYRLLSKDRDFGRIAARSPLKLVEIG